tara:strand:- start:301 stop:459 length:159 start_codon:yes stop_codon:yes gene_type:complete
MQVVSESSITESTTASVGVQSLVEICWIIAVGPIKNKALKSDQANTKMMIVA